jgi:hypothetical protein
MIEGPRVRHRHRRGVKHGARPYGAITSAVRATRKKIVKRESHQRYILCCCWGVMIYFVLLGGYEIFWQLLKLLMQGRTTASSGGISLGTIRCTNGVHYYAPIIECNPNTITTTIMEYSPSPSPSPSFVSSSAACCPS